MVGMRTQKRTGREMQERSRGGGGLWVGSVVAVGGGTPWTPAAGNGAFSMEIRARGRW